MKKQVPENQSLPLRADSFGRNKGSESTPKIKTIEKNDIKEIEISKYRRIRISKDTIVFQHFDGLNWSVKYTIWREEFTSVIMAINECDRMDSECFDE